MKKAINNNKNVLYVVYKSHFPLQYKSLEVKNFFFFFLAGIIGGPIVVLNK